MDLAAGTCVSSLLFQECSNDEAGDEEAHIFNVVDAFQVPRFSYCTERKKYLADKALGKPEPKLYSGGYSLFFLQVLVLSSEKQEEKKLALKTEVNVRVCCVVKLSIPIDIETNLTINRLVALAVGIFRRKTS